MSVSFLLHVVVIIPRQVSFKKSKNYLSRVMRKPDFAEAKTMAQISLTITAKLISAFVFATRIVQFLYFLDPNFQPLAIFCACAARSESDLVGTPKTGFLMSWLI